MRIIVEYYSIKRKMNDPDCQSWYALKGLKSDQKKLIELAKKYEEIRSLFNNSSIDFFIEQINENTRIKSGYENHGMNTIQQMHYSSVSGKLHFYKELARLKSKTGCLLTIDEYLEHPEAFIDLMN